MVRIRFVAAATLGLAVRRRVAPSARDGLVAVVRALANASMMSSALMLCGMRGFLHLVYCLPTTRGRGAPRRRAAGGG